MSDTEARLLVRRSPSPSAAPVESLEALIQGIVTVTDGCVALETDERTESKYFLIWPAGFEFRSATEDIVDEANAVRAMLGDRLEVSGGKIGFEDAMRRLPETESEPCRGKYWLVGEQIRRL